MDIIKNSKGRTNCYKQIANLLSVQLRKLCNSLINECSIQDEIQSNFVHNILKIIQETRSYPTQYQSLGYKRRGRHSGVHQRCVMKPHPFLKCF